LRSLLGSHSVGEETEARRWGNNPVNQSLEGFLLLRLRCLRLRFAWLLCKDRELLPGGAVYELREYRRGGLRERRLVKGAAAAGRRLRGGAGGGGGAAGGGRGAAAGKANASGRTRCDRPGGKASRLRF